MTRDKAARRAALSSFSLPSVDLSFLSCPVPLSLSLSLFLCVFFSRVSSAVCETRRSLNEREGEIQFSSLAEENPN